MSPEPVRPPCAEVPRTDPERTDAERTDAARPGDPARAGAAGRGVLFLLAIAAGATIPVQARLNGGLAERAGDRRWPPSPPSPPGSCSSPRSRWPPRGGDAP
ncbi:DMT family transporter [Micrococcus endophyticus]|uniref:DMT family transporter n=1 Tax=Micrococcus endophyticus TaxID=455343 RepID=UPI00200688BB|nr:DMT family transporter [Micrococcus endophyticus]MCK6090790.1 DMT family transporter [Micrococcus endophyticus]